MESWVAIALVVGIILFLVGSLSTFSRSAKQPLRKKSLNELEETLPRSNKEPHKMPSVKNKPQ